MNLNVLFDSALAISNSPKIYGRTTSFFMVGLRVIGLLVAVWVIFWVMDFILDIVKGFTIDRTYSLFFPAVGLSTPFFTDSAVGIKSKPHSFINYRRKSSDSAKLMKKNIDSSKGVPPETSDVSSIQSKNGKLNHALNNVK